MENNNWINDWLLDDAIRKSSNISNFSSAYEMKFSPTFYSKIV